MQTLHMNAVKVTEKQLAKLNLADWIVDEKFKGIRVWRIKEAGRVRLITRGLEDVTRNFPHLVDYDWTPNHHTSQLDCELFDPNQEDEVVSGWANTKQIIPSITEQCVLKVFDVLTLDHYDLSPVPQLKRKQILDGLKLRGPCEAVQWFEATEHRAYYDHIISRGGEGVMLKNKLSTYQGGVRQVGRWLKRKKRDPFDCIVLGFTSAKEGKFAGLIGAVTVGQYIAGELRPICNVSGMDDATRVDMTRNPQNYIGRACSIYAVDQHRATYSLSEPSWKGLRIDKRPEECIYSAEEHEKPEDKMIEL